VLKGQDILVLAALVSNSESSPKLPDLAEALSLGLGPIHRSLGRLHEAGLVNAERRVQLAQADEFFEHALRYVFPPRMRGETRGMPTSWAASPLRDRLAPQSGPQLVWPHPNGDVRGIAFEPIHAAVPEAARKDADLYEMLALIDALRTNDPRIRNLAHDELRVRLAALTGR